MIYLCTNNLLLNKRIRMKYIVSISLWFLMQSCIPSSACIVNEYTNFPKGLKYKEFKIKGVLEIKRLN